MKKRNLVFAACALLVVGCQHFTQEPRREMEGFDPGVVRPPRPSFPNVFITSNGNIVVDQEPIRIPRGEPQRVKVSWALAAGSPYTFPGNGIGIDEELRKRYKFECPVTGQGKVITCTFDRPPSGRPLKYTIRVKDRNRDLPDLDPTIMPE